MVPGFAPLAQLGADDVPWGEVGSGWFAFDYHFADQDSPDVDFDPTPLPQLKGGVSLVSPDGTWYAAQSLDSLGSGVPLTWDGSNIWVGTTVQTNSETGIYSVDIRDLASGEKTGSIVDHRGENDAAIEPSQVLTHAYRGDGLDNSVDGLGIEGMGACSTAGSGFWGWEADDMSFTHSPARGGQLACFGPNEAGDRTVATRHRPQGRGRLDRGILRSRRRESCRPDGNFRCAS